MNEGTRSLVVMKPLAAPMAAPAASTTPTETQVFQPWLTVRMATSPPSRPSSEPTDRSISPAMMTNTMPQASMPVTDICRNRLEMLFGRRKVPLVWLQKKIQISATASSKASTL